jgi:hypothetical protein
MSKQVAKLGAICVVGALAIAPAVGAYNVPGTHPGQPGGPNTKPKGGKKVTKTNVGKVAGRMTGFTAAELAAKGSIHVTLHYPKAGQFKCSVSGASGSQTAKIGSGKSKNNHHGAKNITIIFSSSGIAFLDAHNLQGVLMTVSCTFKPKHGTKSTSTTTFETSH